MSFCHREVHLSVIVAATIPRRVWESPVLSGFENMPVCKRLLGRSGCNQTFPHYVGLALLIHVPREIMQKSSHRREGPFWCTWTQPFLYSNATTFVMIYHPIPFFQARSNEAEASCAECSIVHRLHFVRSRHHNHRQESYEIHS